MTTQGVAHELDRALTRRRTAPGRWRADLDEGWLIGQGINGGLVLALVTAALRDDIVGSAGGNGHADPVAVSAHFVSAARPGPCDVLTETVRVGRTVSTGAVRLVQDGPDGPVERLRALVTFGDLDVLGGPVHLAPEAPDMPPPEACLPARREAGTFAEAIAILDRLDLRLDPATAGWALGRPSGNGEIRAWLRMRDGRQPDVAALPFVLDALPPVAFDLGAMGWAPTLELTAYLHRRPAPGWLAVQVRTTQAAGGLLEEDATVWDSTGAVVARSRQLAGVRVP